MLKVLICACAILVTSSLAAALEGWPDELKGDGLVVRFDPDPANAKGLIIKGDQRFRFAGKADAATITGAFAAGDQRFDFTLVKQGNAYVLKSGQKSYTLTGVGEAPQPPDPVPPQRGILFSRQPIVDAKSQLPVSTILVPNGWQLHGNIEWRINHSFFVVNSSAVFDPKTGWGVRMLPFDHLNCLPGTYRSAVQQGQDLLTLGGMELCGTVPTAEQYATGLLIPRYRKQEGLRVVESKDLPDVAKTLFDAFDAQIRASAANGYSTHFTAARVRIEYTVPQMNNATIEEDVYCMVEVTWNEQANRNMVASGFPDAQTWLIRPVAAYSFIAPKGQLERATPILRTIQSSQQYTDRWIAFTSQIANFIRQKNLDDAKLIAATRAEITESQRQTWREMTDQYDRVNRSAGYLLGDTQVYGDPNNQVPIKYVLEQKYDHWINDKGDIYSTDDPAHPPEGTGWRKMKWVYPK